MRLLAKTSGLGLAVLLAFGVTGVAQAQECVYDGWDTSADGMIDPAEFRTGFSNENWFNDYDDDDDGLLSTDEFELGADDWGIDSAGMWTAFDANEDDMVDEDEFANGMFDAWDADDDVMIGCEEYAGGIDWFE